jgi:hypothetical protein
LIFALISYCVLGLASQVIRVRAFNSLSHPFFTIGTRRGSLSYSIGFVLNFLFPFRVGELARSEWIARKAQASRGITLAVIFTERALDSTIFLLLIASLAQLGATTITFSLLPLSLLSLFVLGKYSLTKLKPAKLLLKFGKGRQFDPSSPKLRLSVGFFEFCNFLRRVTGRSLIKAAGYLLLSWSLWLWGIFLLLPYFPGLLNTWVDWNTSIYPLPTVVARSFETGGGALINMAILSAPLVLLGSIVSAVPSRNGRAVQLLRGFENVDVSSGIHRRKIGRKLLSAPAPNAKLLGGGSGATVTLANDVSGVYVSKEASGKNADKLLEQAAFMDKYSSEYSFPKILDISKIGSQVSLKIEFLDGYLPLERALWSDWLPSQELRSSIIYTVIEDLHRANGEEHSLSEDEIISSQKEVWDKKIKGVLDSISIFAPEFLMSEYVVVNGVTVRNLPLLFKTLEGHKKVLTAKSHCLRNHGDPTISNIFIAKSGSSFKVRFIDPNPLQPAFSRSVDYGKLMQSLHGSYEAIFETGHIESLGFSEINFSYLENPSTKEASSVLDRFLNEAGEEIYLQSYFQMLFHFLRLIPYRIAKDRYLSPAFLGQTLLIGDQLLNLLSSRSTPNSHE